MQKKVRLKIISPDFFLLLKLDKSKVAIYTQDENINTNNNSEQEVTKMELSNGELMVMEVLWEGECLDENGEIQALELSKVLKEKYDLGKTSCYTFFGRLLEKGAITRRYPKYTIKPIVTREEALQKQREEAIDKLFQGSFISFCRAFLKDKKISKEEVQEMKNLLKDFEKEDK